MTRFLVWYLPQTALFCLALWFWFQIPEPPPFHAAMLVGVMLAAAYTGGANLVISLVARLRRHKGQAGRDGLSLVGTGSGSAKAAEQRKRIGVRE